MGIVLQKVSKIYGEGEVKTYALNEVSTTLNDGEVIVILGPSGSGKSTMLNVISGLDTPTSGDIYFNDVCISGYDSKKLTRFRREHLGFIFQQYNLLQNLNVKENVEMGAAIGKEPLDLDEVLEAVGLEDKKNKYPYQLSGGEQQRVAIARSIAKNPNVLFCDEPTGALDEETGKQVLQLLIDMNSRYGATIVIITHNPSIAQLADVVIKMNSGQIVETLRNTNKKKVGDIGWA